MEIIILRTRFLLLERSSTIPISLDLILLSYSLHTLLFPFFSRGRFENKLRKTKHGQMFGCEPSFENVREHHVSRAKTKVDRKTPSAHHASAL